MSLITRFQALFRPKSTQEQPATLATPPMRPSSLVERFSADRDRRSIIEDARRMVDEDPRVQGIIKTVARDAVKNGFDLIVEGPGARKAKKIGSELLARLDFWTRVEDWVRLTL